MTEEKATQKKRILEHLLTGRTLTPLDALNLYGCFRLATRIFELKAEGYNIITERNENGKPYAIYKLAAGAQQLTLKL